MKDKKNTDTEPEIALSPFYEWFGRHDGELMEMDCEDIAREAWNAAQQPSPWRPIETAPRDGVEALCWLTGGFGYQIDIPEQAGPRCTHYQPLPPPPAEDTTVKERVARDQIAEIQEARKNAYTKPQQFGPPARDS